MLIQFDTDNHIDGNERLHVYMEDKLNESLKRFSSHITRLEIHLADENGARTGGNDKRCVLEAHVEGIKPIAVTAHADDIERAVNEAITKLKSALDTTLGKLTEKR